MVKNENYIPRHLGRQLRSFVRQFPVVVVLGARQAGKTTFLQHELPDWRRVDLEDAGTAEIVGRDPALFLQEHPQSVWFDEAHRVPSLFPALRVEVDRQRSPGRFVLSGSATGALTREVSESLAGRAGVLVLHPFTASEAAREPPSDFLARLLTCEGASDVLAALSGRRPLSPGQVRSSWVSGGFPEPALLSKAVARRRWFESYVRLVSERDLLAAEGSLRPVAVRRLLRMLAARHGQVLNVSALARDFGMRAGGVGGFLDLLEGAFLWHRMEPYTSNIGKRLVRSPKAWIADSGLLHALLDIAGFDDLDVHPSVGPSFEGWVVQNLLAQAALLDYAPRFHHWRTHAGAEVDIVLEHGRRLYPIEVKRGTRVHPYDLRGMSSFLESFKDTAPFGVVLYNGPQAQLLKNVAGIPVDLVV